MTQEVSKGTVYLPSQISDIFGASLAEIQRELAVAQILIDDEPWQGDRTYLPVEEIDGKTVTIKGPVRTFRFAYKHEE